MVTKSVNINISYEEEVKKLEKQRRIELAYTSKLGNMQYCDESDSDRTHVRLNMWHSEGCEKPHKISDFKAFDDAISAWKQTLGYHEDANTLTTEPDDIKEFSFPEPVWHEGMSVVEFITTNGIPRILAKSIVYKYAFCRLPMFTKSRKAVRCTQPNKNACQAILDRNWHDPLFEDITSAISSKLVELDLRGGLSIDVERLRLVFADETQATTHVGKFSTMVFPYRKFDDGSCYRELREITTETIKSYAANYDSSSKVAYSLDATMTDDDGNDLPVYASDPHYIEACGFKDAFLSVLARHDVVSYFDFVSTMVSEKMYETMHSVFVYRLYGYDEASIAAAMPDMTLDKVKKASTKLKICYQEWVSQGNKLHLVHHNPSDSVISVGTEHPIAAHAGYVSDCYFRPTPSGGIMRVKRVVNRKSKETVGYKAVHCHYAKRDKQPLYEVATAETSLCNLPCYIDDGFSVPMIGVLEPRVAIVPTIDDDLQLAAPEYYTIQAETRKIDTKGECGRNDDNDSKHAEFTRFRKFIGCVIPLEKRLSSPLAYDNYYKLLSQFAKEIGYYKEYQDLYGYDKC